MDIIRATLLKIYYDYRYSVLLWVFARLIRDEWLNIDELEGLSEDKLSRINNLLDL